MIDGSFSAIFATSLNVGLQNLVLTDVVMPGMSGPDLARHLAGRRPEVKVVFVSGYTDDAIVQVGVQPETAFLHKPFTANALGRKLRETLDQLLPDDCVTTAPTRAL